MNYSYIQISPAEKFRKTEQKNKEILQRENYINENTGFKKTNLAFHPSPEHSVIHDVYMKLDKHGYHYCYVIGNTMYTIIKDMQKPIHTKTKIGKGVILGPKDDPRKTNFN